MKSSEKKRQNYFEAPEALNQRAPIPKTSTNTILEIAGSSPNYTKMLRSPVKDKTELETVDGRVSVAKSSEKLSDKRL